MSEAVEVPVEAFAVTVEVPAVIEEVLADLRGYRPDNLQDLQIDKDVPLPI